MWLAHWFVKNDGEEEAEDGNYVSCANPNIV